MSCSHSDIIFNLEAISHFCCARQLRSRTGGFLILFGFKTYLGSEKKTSFFIPLLGSSVSYSFKFVGISAYWKFSKNGNYHNCFEFLWGNNCKAVVLNCATDLHFYKNMLRIDYTTLSGKNLHRSLKARKITLFYYIKFGFGLVSAPAHCVLSLK